jgi:hypothetical protein
VSEGQKTEQFLSFSGRRRPLAATRIGSVSEGRETKKF